MTQYAGTAGDLIAGAESLEVTEWSASFSGEALEVTDKGSGGWQEVIPGLRKVDLSASGVFDSAINNSDPPEVRVGQTLTFTGEISDGGDSMSGSFLVTGWEYSSPVDGSVEYSFEGTSNGQVYMAGESTS